MPTLKKKTAENISLKEYFDSKFNELRDYVDIRFSNVDKATTLANDVLAVRLESMNEFRESLKDQTANFITKSEHENLIKQLDEVRLFQAAQRGMATQKSVYAAYLISAVGIIIGLLK